MSKFGLGTTTRRNAPRITGTVRTPAQNWLQHVSVGLNPAASCSWPNTSTRFRLRPAVVFGTDAQALAKGAAAGVAATLGLPVALVATTRTTRVTPAKSQKARTLEAPIVRPGR